jgi:hypothetical protein
LRIVESDQKVLSSSVAALELNINENKELLSVYPNPTSDFVVVKTSIKGAGILELMDMQRRILEKKTLVFTG